jgi:hypothetical protein
MRQKEKHDISVQNEQMESLTRVPACASLCCQGAQSLGTDVTGTLKTKLFVTSFASRQDKAEMYICMYPAGPG